MEMVLLVIILLLFRTGFQLEIDHWGNHFVLTFLQNGLGEVENSLIITTREESNVLVTFHENNQAKELVLRSNESHTLYFNDSTTAKPSLQVLPLKAISIEASKAISVYGFIKSIDPLLHSKEGFLVLPVPSLGVEYLAATCEEDGPQIAIAAVENNTEVEIQIRCDIEVQCYHGPDVSTYPDNHILIFLLHEHDVVNLYCIGDTTGSIVHSTKPVSVISGCSCGRRFHMVGCDHMVEMMPPTTEQGEQFVFAAPANSITLLRIMSTYNVTIFDDTGGFYSHQTHNRFTNVVLPGDEHCLTSDKPMIVVMYMVTSLTMGDKVEALMTVVPPQNKYTLNYSIGIEANSFIHMAVLVCKVGNCPSYSIDFYPICQGRYDIKKEHIYGVKTWGNLNPFMVLVFARSSDTCVGYPAGMALTDYSGVSECSTSPCLNNGWCLEYGMTYRCRCWGGYFGYNCEKDPFESQVENSTASNLKTTEHTTEFLILKNQPLPSKTSNDMGTVDTTSTTINTLTTSDTTMLNFKATVPLSDENKPGSGTTVSSTIASTSDSSISSSTSTSDLSTSTSNFKALTSNLSASDATKTTSHSTTSTTGQLTTVTTSITTGTSTPFITAGLNTTNNVTPTVSHLNATAPVNKILRLCGCPCTRSAEKPKTPKFVTVEEILKVPKKKLGKAQRRKNSAVNLHDSEINLGYSACSMLLFVILVVVITDVCKIIKWFTGWCKLRLTRDSIRV